MEVGVVVDVEEVEGASAELMMEVDKVALAVDEVEVVEEDGVVAVGLAEMIAKV